MDPSHLTELIELEDRYWWHLAKRRLVSKIVQDRFPPPARIVEGGIGSARNLLEFQNLGYQVTGFDLMQKSVVHAKSRGLEDVRVHNLADVWPLEDDTIDAILLLDVLEHIEDPVHVLKLAARTLKPTGAIIFTVPCYQWLYSDWDKSLGHFRRYTRKELKKQATEAGLNVQWLNHWNSFTLPAAIAVRGIQKCFPNKNKKPDFPRVSPLINKALLNFASAERWWISRSVLPAGLSLVGVLTK